MSGNDSIFKSCLGGIVIGVLGILALVLITGAFEVVMETVFGFLSQIPWFVWVIGVMALIWWFKHE